MMCWLIDPLSQSTIVDWCDPVEKMSKEVKP